MPSRAGRSSCHRWPGAWGGAPGMLSTLTCQPRALLEGCRASSRQGCSHAGSSLTTAGRCEEGRHVAYGVHWADAAGLTAPQPGRCSASDICTALHLDYTLGHGGVVRAKSDLAPRSSTQTARYSSLLHSSSMEHHRSLTYVPCSVYMPLALCHFWQRTALDSTAQSIAQQQGGSSLQSPAGWQQVLAAVRGLVQRLWKRVLRTTCCWLHWRCSWWVAVVDMIQNTVY